MIQVLQLHDGKLHQAPMDVKCGAWGSEKCDAVIKTCAESIIIETELQIFEASWSTQFLEEDGAYSLLSLDEIGFVTVKFKIMYFTIRL